MRQLLRRAEGETKEQHNWGERLGRVKKISSFLRYPSLWRRQSGFKDDPYVNRKQFQAIPCGVFL
jgi:hypothetical protein